MRILSYKMSISPHFLSSLVVPFYYTLYNSGIATIEVRWIKDIISFLYYHSVSHATHFI